MIKITVYFCLSQASFISWKEDVCVMSREQDSIVERCWGWYSTLQRVWHQVSVPSSCTNLHRVPKLATPLQISWR